ncbi:anti-phage defense-associated sirtuin Dsr1 [Franconibacter helveticus]|uniref:anti-phage defense-associated sirtuin Dsr1 n=1 Tax=Franconibacter helveticus TaxID=357240 RepID=UPI00066DD6FD|nr:anti-phage defense-associated sirtuin Dsr1 [Franconibacter helveticus]
MQFITHGPDIPDELLQAHEEGRVVFFCGAGISYPADLPGFKGLVEQIYRLNGTTLSEIEREAFERGQFDATLDLLERRLPGQRMAVRRALAKALKPKLRRRGATDTQAALLRLARSREGAVRLVTTNFDRIFHVAAKRTGQAFQAYAAPMLPIPKNSRWDGLVYLHGLLPEKADDTALNRLVVTSGDFGLAYLTERWAARFVSELFRNYVVCFVGYSINDPVLRYMMDALAADRMLGEVTQQAWSLGDCEPGQEHRKAIEWEAKGVTPILYTVPAGTYDHSMLHQTLHAWADTYRDGVQGKEAIVVKHALARPQDSTRQDDFVGRMLWALSDKSGLPAKRFADLNPAPPLDWLLEAFSDERFQYSDLPRFHVPPHVEVDTKLRFSLIRRPAPYDRAPQSLLASGGVSFSQWDDVMFHIARWLVRYLDDPRLIIWIAERGGQMHDRWTWLIEHKLERFAALERDGRTSERDEILLHAPKAIPGTLMTTLWRLLLSGRVKSPWSSHELYRWQGRLQREGLTTTLRLELRELLAPKVVLKKPFLWSDDDSSSTDEPSRINQLVDWELVLAADHVHSTLRDLANEPWKLALPHLLEDFQQLLRDALDLLRELDGADDRSDRSHWDLPSITQHWQNRGFRDWVSLIELLRDAWLVVRSNDSARATRIALSWFELPYPTFKRLALFAASQDDSIPPERWVNWLLEEGAWWLWSTNTGREVFRLFVLQGRNLAGIAQDRLEAAILAGPPREMYRDDLEAEHWKDLVARSVWLHLAKLSTSGLVLGPSAAARLAEISTAYPQWQLATNERDEFSHWMSGTGDPDYEDSRDVDIAPRKRQELVQWLAKPMPERRPFYEDTWRDVCRTRFFHSLSALRELSQDGVWPPHRWREALQTWAEEGMVLRSWRYAAPLVQTMPDAVLQEIDRAVTWWMKVASKISHHEDILLNLCRRVLALETGAESRTIKNGIETYDPVGSAINHPIGHVTQALISLWFKQNPNDNDLLPAELKPIFTALCDVQIDRFRHARVLLGSWLITFFRVDRPWTEQNLLPLFSWSNPIEAKAVWEGFLWSPRLYQPLLIAFKSQLLESANHYVDLGEHRQQFATFLTYAALGPIEGYTVEEFRSAIGALPQEGLEESAQALSQALEGTADQSEDYWKNRAQPFWQQIWPKSRGLATPRISESLTRLVIAARGEFPVALTAVQDWLQPIEHPHYVVHLLHESGMCSRYPADALGLLNAVIVDQQWGPQELGQCLDQIVQADAQLEQDARYQRLSEYSRRYGV